MWNKEYLRGNLKQLDGRGYKAYKDVEGEYDFETYNLLIDHVQGDPFASPSRVRVKVKQEKADFPEDIFSSRSREVALRDYLTRKFSDACRRYSRGNRGTGNSGDIHIERPGQQILERTSVFVSESEVEARYMDGRRTMKQVVDAVLDDIHNKGLDVLQSRPSGNYAGFRGLSNWLQPSTASAPSTSGKDKFSQEKDHIPD